MRHLRWKANISRVWFSYVMTASAVVPVSAQGREVVTGVVTADSQAVAGALVAVTRGPDRAVRHDTTDQGGRYRVEFDHGTGDYLVAIAHRSYRPVRRRVSGSGSGEITANFVLVSSVPTLAQVRIAATQPVRARNTILPQAIETGSADRWEEGVVGQVPPLLVGDLTALLSTIPGVVPGADGASILGSDPGSSLTTLNGMAFGGGAVPRAATTTTRVSGAAYDPLRGGFSGASIDVRLAPGSRDLDTRSVALSVEPAGLQQTDAAGRALGHTANRVRAGAGATGSLVRDALTYSAAIDLVMDRSSPATLFSSGSAPFDVIGLARSAVDSTVMLASAAGIPVQGIRAPSSRVLRTVSLLGRVDDIRDSTRQRTLTLYGTSSSAGALGFAPTAAPTAGAGRTALLGGLQLELGRSFGSGLVSLNTLRFSANAMRSTVAPYLAIPGASVLVGSSDGGVVPVSLGGSGSAEADDRRWTLEASNEFIHNWSGRRHSLRLLAWGRLDGLATSSGGNRLGRFTYSSLDALAAGQPSAFTRVLSEPHRSGRAWNLAGAAAHRYAPSRFLSVLYGARVEAGGLAGAILANDEVRQVFGLRNEARPWDIHVSPRVGFTYSFSRGASPFPAGADPVSPRRISPSGVFYRQPTGILRGGIGEFRDLRRPDHVAAASAATGLPGSSLNLVCVGAAVPEAAWDDFLTAAAVPGTCADASGPLAERAPRVVALAPSYTVPRSWRASLDYSTAFAGMSVRLGALASYDLDQPSTIDANFSGTEAFRLAGEGNRPVFVPQTSIDPASGSLVAAAARKDHAFGPVDVRHSDLRGKGAQVTVALATDLLDPRLRAWPFMSLSWTVQSAKRQYRGFDGASFGDPRLVEWAPASTDARHTIILQAARSSPHFGTLTVFARAQSGLPFTPLIQGDVNGDGRSGDRPYLSTMASMEPTQRQGIEAILSGSSATARDCLTANLGRPVGRNACRGPWSTTLNALWRAPLPTAWQGRTSVSLFLTNLLGGVDAVLNGSNPRGWGSNAAVDPVLLVPRGFDAANGRFVYEVNSHFAATDPRRSAARMPFGITLDVTMSLEPLPADQRLQRALEPVRLNGVRQPRPADSLFAYLMRATSSPHRFIASQSDSLFLTRPQMVQLLRADSAYVQQVRAIFRPVAERIAASLRGGPRLPAGNVIAEAETAYYALMWEQVEVAAGILTPLQIGLTPLARWHATSPADRLRTRFNIGFPVPPFDRPSPSR